MVDVYIDAGVVVALVGVLGGFVYYLFKLRADFYEACRETDNLVLFADCPMGLPIGSVRSTLALVIILFAVGYIVVSDTQDIPQSLTAIVGTVLGFYFGSRSSRESRKDITSVLDRMERRDSGDAAGNVSTADEEGGPGATTRDAPTVDAGESAPLARRQDARDLLDTVREGLSVTQVASRVLPASARKQYAALVSTLEDGLTAVEGLLSSDDVVDAVRTGRALVQRFDEENPVRTTVERAAGSFGRVLEAAVKPLPLIGSLVNVAAAVKGEVYDRWKARILHLPFEPSDLPLERVDANTGFTLLVNVPAMKEAFRSELQANDRPFMETTAEELLQTGDLESLWTDYADRFDSRQQFEDAVAAMRREAADLELKAELDPALFEDVGGYDTVLSAVDDVHQDDDARGDLDALVTIFEALRDADNVSTSLRRLFERVRSHVTPAADEAS
jgi:hypothetical protein